MSISLLNQFLAKTDARDKLYRLVAYGSKVPVVLLKNSHPDISDKLKKGASSVGQGRKLLRLFKSIFFISDCIAASNALSVSLAADPHSNLQVLNDLFAILKSAFLAIWLILDHWQWAAKAGYTSLSGPLEKKISEFHSKAWFFGLLFGALGSVNKIAQLNTPVATTVAASPEGKSPKKNKPQSIDVPLQKQRISLLKNSVDLIIPAQRLGWIPVSDVVVGIAGTFTSLIGIRENLPKRH